MALKDQILMALLRLPREDRLELATHLLQQYDPEPKPEPVMVSTVKFDGYTSSCLASFEYNAATEVLVIRFTNGSVYEYVGVDATTAMGLGSATSPGMYYNYRIKGEYPSRKVS